jgi:hypothetical protein
MGFGKSCGRAATLIALMLAVSLAFACEESETKKDEQATDPNMPPAQVDLPSPPPASAFNIPEKNDDGTLRVEGIIQYKDKHLENRVRVKGVVTQILGDCDPKKAKKTGEPCPQPHYIIQDEEGAEKELMVVGFDREFFEKAKTKVGETHTFEGTYKQMAQQFVNSENGLLLLDKIGEVSVLDEE